MRYFRIPLRYVFAASFCLLIALFSVQIPRVAAAKPAKSHLTVVIPGIHDGMSVEWARNAIAISGPQEQYAIIFDNGTKIANKRIGKYLKAAEEVYDKEHAIRVNVKEKDPASVARYEEKLAEIAKKKNVTVTVDMDILYELQGGVGTRLRDDPWGPQTEWAGKLAARLADEHLKEFPKAKTTLIGHSAGCEAMLQANAVEASTNRVLFNQPPIALSSRNPLAHPKNTLMVQADGDFLNSPGGNPVIGVGTTPTSEELQAKGYNVIRIATPGAQGRSWPDFSDMSIDALSRQGAAVVVALPAHTAVTKMEAEGQKIIVYPAGQQGGREMPPTTLGNTIKTVIGTVDTSDPKGASVNLEKIDEQVKKLRDLGPTSGLGGISLNAIANTPFEPTDISDVSYSGADQRLFVNLADGRRVPLPKMDPVTLKLAYQVVIRDGKKPELSIGSVPEGMTERPSSPGNYTVYYLGNTEGTTLGLAMFEADEALGKLAFSGTRDVKPVADHVPGFHSLPEMYPERYVGHPTQGRYPGAGTIFLTSARVDLNWTKDESELEFGNTGFSVSFDKATPAEQAYGAFFIAHLDEISATPMGQPFRNLTPYAQASAVFRWIKENDIPFSGDELESVSLASAFTPHETPTGSALILGRDEIAPRAPTVKYGPYGPEAIYRTDGRKTIIKYDKELPVRVERYDGKVLRVKRDGIGNPVGLHLGADYDAGFYSDVKMGQVFAENIKLQDDKAKVSIQLTDQTVVYPASAPEGMVRAILTGFSLEDEAPSRKVEEEYDNPVIEPPADRRNFFLGGTITLAAVLLGILVWRRFFR
jgi:hypothetical protein